LPDHALDRADDGLAVHGTGAVAAVVIRGGTLEARARPFDTY
jgi:hypothetical protein